MRILIIFNTYIISTNKLAIVILKDNNNIWQIRKVNITVI